MSLRSLRENVELLREYMFSASAYPGPEPGKMWSLNVAYNGSPQARIFRQNEKDKEDEKQRAFKRKKADFRSDLRKLSLWLQQKHAQ